MGGRWGVSWHIPLGFNTGPSLQVIGHEHVWAQMISVEDDAAVALGTLEGRAEVVLAMKSLPGWTSVYTLNPVLPASFLRALARDAGVHVYSDHDDTLYASRSFLTLAANLAGPRRIRLPRRSDAYDPFTGMRTSCPSLTPTATWKRSANPAPNPSAAMPNRTSVCSITRRRWAGSMPA